MLVVPKILNPKLRKDLNHTNPINFESLWIECNISSDLTFRKKQLIKISYNPLDSFLEELSTSIDYAITENKPMTLMGAYNIDYLNNKEKQYLDTITVPYGLNIVNTEIPTRVRGKSKSLLDYIITDLPGSINFESYVSDTPLRNLNGEHVDHFQTSVISNVTLHQPPKVIIKEIYDKSNYKAEKLREIIRYSDWTNFYNQNCAEGMYTCFTSTIEKCVNAFPKRKFLSEMTNKSNLTI